MGHQVQVIGGQARAAQPCHSGPRRDGPASAPAISAHRLPIPQGLHSIAYNLLVATLVYLNHEEHLRCELVNCQIGQVQRRPGGAVNRLHLTTLGKLRPVPLTCARELDVSVATPPLSSLSHRGGHPTDTCTSS